MESWGPISQPASAPAPSTTPQGFRADDGWLAAAKSVLAAPAAQALAEDATTDVAMSTVGIYNEGFGTGSWQCHVWTRAEQAKLDADNSVGNQERVCTDRGLEEDYRYVWTHGDHTRAQGCGACWCCQQWNKPVAPQEVAPNPKYAFVMMAWEPGGHVSDQTWSALAVAKMLHGHSRYSTVLLTNSTTFPDGKSMREVFEPFRVTILPVYEVALPSDAGWTVAHWRIAFWKLQVWKLTQYEKLIWLDTDVLLYRSIDWMFDRPWMWAQRDDWECDADSKTVCSGIMMLYPSSDDFNGLMDYFKIVGASLEHGDQELIELYFKNVKKQPLQLLSPMEASFGHCVGSAPSGEVKDEVLAGWWSVPAFIHKSGGWGNLAVHRYTNVCFTHDVGRQRYYIGREVINACHFNPLAGYWRKMFCSALQESGVSVPIVNEFCKDKCYYKGELHDDAECPLTLGIFNGPLEGDLANIQDMNRLPPGGWKLGMPAPEVIEKMAPYRFNWGQSWGDLNRTIVYHDARLPDRQFTIMGSFRTALYSECQEIIGWFSPFGESVELWLAGQDLAYAETSKMVATQGLSLADGAFHKVALTRSEAGIVDIYVDNVPAARARFPAAMPTELSSEARSAQPSGCSLTGEVQDFLIWDTVLDPRVLMELT